MLKMRPTPYDIAALLHFATRHIFEPAFDWVLNHSIISLLMVIALLYWAVRGYRML